MIEPRSCLHWLWIMDERSGESRRLVTIRFRSGGHVHLLILDDCTALSQLAWRGEIYFKCLPLGRSLQLRYVGLERPMWGQNIESFDVLWLFPSPDGKYRLLMRDEKKSLSSLNRSHRVWSRHPTGHHVFRAGHCQRPAGLAVNDC